VKKNLQFLKINRKRGKMKLEWIKAFCFIGAVVCSVVVMLYSGSKYLPVPETKEMSFAELTQLQQEAYEQGVNDTIEAMAAVALQGELERTNRVWSVMFDMVRDKVGAVSLPPIEWSGKK
jgi:hypothetical protein